MKKLLKAVCLLVLLSMFASTAFAAGDVIIVGTNPEFAPFEFVGDDGTVQGVDIDLIGAIAAEMGKTVQIESMDFDALIPAMLSGKIEMVIAGMTIDEERGRSVLFSDPYFDATQSIIIRADNAEIAGPDDLNGKKIGVQLGTTGDLFCTDSYPDADVQRYTKGMDAVMDLDRGSIDAVVIDEAPAKVFVEKGQGLVVLPDKLSNEQYGIAMPLGSDELAAEVNAALRKIIEDGTYDEILAKYDILTKE